MDWTVDWTVDWIVDWTVDCVLRTKNAHQRTGVTMASMDGEVSANPPVIVISCTSDSEQSDPETQESLALKLLGMQLETSECLRRSRLLTTT